MISGELPTRVTSEVSQEEHERAGVDHSQGTVDLEGVGLDRDLQPLADDDLENIAGLNILDASLHCGFEFGLARNCCAA